MKKIKFLKLADLSLLLVAVIWGGGFIATQYAIEAGMSASLIMALRFFIAAISLFAAFFKEIMKSTKREIFHGCIAGIFLFIGFFSQTIGQAITTVSKSAFITATNVVMVPFIVWIFTKKRPDMKTFILTATSFLGIAILTMSFTGEKISLGLGDMLVLLSAFCFALQISYLGITCTEFDPRRISFWQITMSAVISLFAFIFLGGMGEVTLAQLKQGFLPVVFLGVFSTCICYFIQTKAQKYTSPAKAGVLLSTEGFFGSLFSVLLGFELLTPKLVIGGIIVMLSVILMSIDTKIFAKRD